MIVINKEACIGCQKCAADCIGHHIKFEDNKAVMNTDCLQCGHCVAVCPANAVSIPAYDMNDVVEYDPETFRLDSGPLLNAIKFRRSIRNYKQQPVEPEKIDMLIQAGRYTATAKNNQSSRFIFIQDDLAKLKELVWGNIESLVDGHSAKIPHDLLPYAAFWRQYKKDPANDYLFHNAPVVVYITSDWPLDGGLAAQNMELMAVSQGLGTLFNGYLERISDQNEELKHWLGIEDTKIAACMLLGYPKVTYKRTAPRRSPNVILR